LINKLLIAVFVFMGMVSCATTQLPPIGEMDALQLQEDEKRIWNRSGEEQRRLNSSSYIYEDPVLSAYLNEVAQNLIPQDIRGKGLSFQVRVIRNPLLNAFAYPNGVIYVHTGLISKMENEAQLAALLGHEMSHVTHRHAIENYRSVKNTTAVLATIQMASVPFGAYGSLANTLGTLGAMAAVTGYSRELETEADNVGLVLLINAGYDPKEAPKLFEHLKRDVEQQEKKEPFFFGTHPRLQERIDNYTRLIKTKYPDATGMKNTKRFMNIISSLILDNAMMDLSMGRFSSAEDGIGRFLQSDSQNSRAHFYLGELYRQRNDEADREKAINEYNLSITYDPSNPEPHKGSGLIYYKLKRYQEAKAEFEKYLTLFPDADDAAYIEQYIKAMPTK
jgi:beta-barrel assembly-enhancing protease